VPYLPVAFRAKLDTVDTAFREMHQYFDELVEERRAGKTDASQRRDLFNLLLAAKDNETGKGISEDELRGNLYVRWTSRVAITGAQEPGRSSSS
jgi:cytochrome P450